MKTCLLAAALAAIAVPACSRGPAPLPDADPALWVVKDNDTIVYLFGTFHLLDGKQAWFNDEVKTAFDASQEVMLEAILPEDPAKIQPLVLKYATDPAGGALSEKLDPELLLKLDQELKNLGLAEDSFEATEPWFVATALGTLGARKLGLTGENGPERAFVRAAKATGKRLGELEGVEFQLAMLDGLSPELQLAMLKESVDQMAKLGEVFRPMVAAWARGDNDALVAKMNEGTDENPALYKSIFTDRNAAWADWVGKRMDKPGTVFVAVGAGHLAGRNSLLDMLAKRGLKVERVPSRPAP